MFVGPREWAPPPNPCFRENRWALRYGIGACYKVFVSDSTSPIASTVDSLILTRNQSSLNRFFPRVHNGKVEYFMLKR